MFIPKINKGVEQKLKCNRFDAKNYVLAKQILIPEGENYICFSYTYFSRIRQHTV